MLLIYPLEQIQFLPLLLQRRAGSRIQIDNGGRTVAKQSSLIRCRQVAVPPNACTADGGASAIPHHYETGQIFVFGPQAIGQPRTYRSASWKHVPGQGVIDRRSVVVVIDLYAVNESEIVNRS